MRTLIKFKDFQDRIEHYHGKYAAPTKDEKGDELSELQKDAQAKYGFVPSLDDPAFAPTPRKLRTLWARIVWEKKGKKGDQEYLKAVLNHFQSNPKLFGDLDEMLVQYQDRVKGEPFRFYYQTAAHKELLKKAGAMTEVDATHSTTNYGFLLFFFCVKDSLNKARVCGLFLIENEDFDELKLAFDWFKKNNPDWKPELFFTDFARNQMRALEETWLAKVYLCWQHQDRNWAKNFRKKTPKRWADCKTPLKTMKELRYKRTEKEFKAFLSQIKRKAWWKGDIAEYMAQWLSKDIVWRWADYGRRKIYTNKTNSTGAIEGLNQLNTIY